MILGHKKRTFKILSKFHKIKKNIIDENKLANVVKAYDKTKADFFDQIKPMTNPEVKKESKNYNQKIKIHLVYLMMIIIKNGEKGEGK